MAKRIVGVQEVKSIIHVPTEVTRYRVSTGRLIDNLRDANREQAAINKRKDAEKPIRDFLLKEGMTYGRNRSIVSLARLADALLDPKFSAKLYAIAG